MGENSGIQWTTHTFNPWWGCQRVSPGCVNCYAEALDKRVGGGIDPKDGVKKTRWGAKAPRVRTSLANWKQPVRWNKAALEAGRRDRVFCASMADVFEERAELARWRFELFSLIRQTPHLDWLLLTKRPENVMRMMEECERGPAPSGDGYMTSDTNWEETRLWLAQWRSGRAPANIWLGTTVEDQQRANERIPELLKVPATVRFLSMEPLLERVDLEYPAEMYPDGPAYCCDGRECGCYGKPIDPPLFYGIDWVIIGGESGGNARPFYLDWARDLVRQCRGMHVAPFVKQMGSQPWLIGEQPHRRVHFDDHHGGELAEWPSDLRVREFPTPASRGGASAHRP